MEGIIVTNQEMKDTTKDIDFTSSLDKGFASSKTILKVAIQKAIDNGWSDAPGMTAEEIADSFKYIRLTPSIFDLIYNHDFAKSLWGEDRIKDERGDFISDTPAWKHHLLQMVIAEDPIKYLGEHLE